MANKSYKSFNEYVKHLPYDKSFEFPEKRLKYGKCLGEGNFGTVHLAIAKNIKLGEKKTLVAVKSVKDSTNTEALDGLVSEMKILIHVGKHLNVVNLLGAVTKHLKYGDIKVIVEYCPYGNLQTFLKENRNIFVNQIDPISDAIDSKIDQDILKWESNIAINDAQSSTYGYIGPTTALLALSTIPASIENEIADAPPGIDDTNKIQETIVPKITKYNTTDLICWAFQITLGMDYISKRNIMHGDLALRNVLLSDNNVVKVCDFGLAKSIASQYDHYHKSKPGQLPVKWLAIESLQDHDFSIKSDVWAFGIVLWELFSLGANPYPGIDARGYELLQRLKTGYRMEKPEYSNQEIYDIMLKCWQTLPSNRPKFSELQMMLAKYLQEEDYSHYVQMNEPYVQFNNEYFKNTEGDLNLTSLYVPMEIAPAPKYDDKMAKYVNDIHNLDQHAPTTSTDDRYVQSPKLNSQKIEFDFKDARISDSPQYENNFRSFRRNQVKN